MDLKACVSVFSRTQVAAQDTVARALQGSFGSSFLDWMMAGRYGSGKTFIGFVLSFSGAHICSSSHLACSLGSVSELPQLLV